MTSDEIRASREARKQEAIASGHRNLSPRPIHPPSVDPAVRETIQAARERRSQAARTKSLTRNRAKAKSTRREKAKHRAAKVRCAGVSREASLIQRIAKKYAT